MIHSGGKQLRLRVYSLEERTATIYTAPLKTIADGKRLTEGVTGNRSIQL